MNQPISFATDIRPIFTQFDRDLMLFAFDLWEVDDVKAYAAGILERLEVGDMPCDRRWPDEDIALFDRWLAGGCQG